MAAVATFEELISRAETERDKIITRRVPSFEELAGPEPGQRMSTDVAAAAMEGMQDQKSEKGRIGAPLFFEDTVGPERPPYGFTPGRELDIEGFGAREPLQKEEAKSLVARFGKKIANSFAQIGETIISHPFSPVGVPEREKRKYRKQAFQELEASGFKGSAAQAEQLIRTRTAQIAAAEKVPKFKVDEPETVGEKATDVTAGLTAFISQLALTKKILPAGTSEPLIWEVQNQLGGGIPGQGMAIRHALGGIGKIPTSTLAGKTGKVALESGLFAGTTAALGGETEDILISASIPVVFNTYSFAKQKRVIISFTKARKAGVMQKYEARKADIARVYKEKVGQINLKEPNPKRKIALKREAEAEYRRSLRSNDTFLADDIRKIKVEVDATKQRIYQDDAFAPAREKWRAERVKALKLIAKGGKENIARGNAILDFIETKAVTSRRQEIDIPTTRVGEVVETAKEVGKKAVKRVAKVVVPTKKPPQKPVVKEVKAKKPEIGKPVEPLKPPVPVSEVGKEPTARVTPTEPPSEVPVGKETGRVEAKQPWEMTRDEHMTAFGQITLGATKKEIKDEILTKLASAKKEYDAALESGKPRVTSRAKRHLDAMELHAEMIMRGEVPAPYLWGDRAYMRTMQQHKKIVKEAIEQGKPVPREVLEEYKSEPWAKEALEKAPQAKPEGITLAERQQRLKQQLKEVKEAVSEIAPDAKVKMAHPNAKNAIQVNKEGTEIQVHPELLQKIKEQYPDQETEMLRLLIEEELIHQEQINELGGAEQAEKAFEEEWKNASHELKQAVREVVAEDRSDAQMGAELLRLREQLKRGRIAEDLVGERKEAVNKLRDMLKITPTPAKPGPTITPVEGEVAWEKAKEKLVKEKPAGIYDEDPLTGQPVLIKPLNKKSIIEKVRKNEGGQAAQIVKELLDREIQTIDVHVKENEVIVQIQSDRTNPQSAKNLEILEKAGLLWEPQKGMTYVRVPVTPAKPEVKVLIPEKMTYEQWRAEIARITAKPTSEQTEVEIKFREKTWPKKEIRAISDKYDKQTDEAFDILSKLGAIDRVKNHTPLSNWTKAQQKTILKNEKLWDKLSAEDRVETTAFLKKHFEELKRQATKPEAAITPKEGELEIFTQKDLAEMGGEKDLVAVFKEELEFNKTEQDHISDYVQAKTQQERENIRKRAPTIDWVEVDSRLASLTPAKPEVKPVEKVEAKAPITKAEKNALRDKGYKLSQILKMKPEEARGLLGVAPTEEPAEEQRLEKVEKKVPEGGGAVGDIGGGPERIQVSMEPGGKVQTAVDIVKYIETAFNIPMRGVATHKKKYPGWFDPKAIGIRMKDVRALTTAMHEIGHHIDWTLNNRLSKNPPNAEMRKELLALGKALYGQTKPPGGYKSEGFAEFIREYLTGDEAESKAPAVFKWFKEDYLPKNRDIDKKLDITKGMITRWRAQGAEARIESQISRKRKKGTMFERMKRASLWVERAFRSELEPIRRAMKKVGIKESEIPTDENPYQIAVARADKSGAIARFFVEENTTDLAGNVTGKGLKEILKPVTKDIKTFTQWVIAARARLLHSKGINPGISAGDANYVYEKYDNPQWQETLKEVTEWNHRVLDYLVEAGGMEKKARKAIIAANPIYVPFMREFVEGEINFGQGIGRGVAKTTKAVKKIKGSGRAIIDPFESMIQQAAKIIGVAHKTQVALALAKFANKKGAAGMIWKVPAPTQATQFQAEQLKKDIARIAYQRMGLDPDEVSAAMLEQWDEVLTVYSNASHYYGKDNIVSFSVDGKRQFYEVEPNLYRAIEGLDRYTMPRVWDFIFGKPARAVRLGATGLNASFGLIRNFLRDALTFTVLSKHAKAGPLSAVRGIAEDIARTTGAQKFKALGGKMSAQILADRKALRHLKKEILVSTVSGKVVYTVAHPIDALRELFGVSEAGTRIGEFIPALKAAEKKYGKGSMSAAIEALNAAQDVTTNFSRHGQIGKVLNQVIPFFNAAIQGPDKILRTFAERPATTSLKAIFALTLPALWLWWRHKDDEWYKNMPDYERINYMHFKIPGKDTIIRIPVPFELGHIFQSAPVAALDAKYRKDPKLVTEMFSEVLEQANPLDWPALISPIVDVMANRDFAGRPIVPKSVEYKMPQDQYKRYTSRLMKLIGKTINYSPAKLEHLVNNYSGGLFLRVSRTVDLKNKKDITASDMPVIGTLFLRESYAPRAQLDRFYTKRDILNRKYSSKRITGLEKRKRKRYNEAAGKISELLKKLPDAKTQAEKIRIYSNIKTQLRKSGAD